MHPPFDLAGRHLLVTGCGSPTGIGFACARALAGLGAAVTITSTTERIHERVAQLRALGARVEGHVADLTAPEQADALMRAAGSRSGSLDGLVHSAGMVQTGTEEMGLRTFAEMTPAFWQRSLDLNLSTAVHVLRAMLPGMAERRYGRVVLISSVTGGFVATPGEAAYGAAKAALDGLMRTLAVEYGRSGITVNCVAPGWIATGSSTAVELEAGRHTPVGRPGTPDEIASLAAYLCCESAGYLTGQSIVVDGGNMIQEPHGVELY